MCCCFAQKNKLFVLNLRNTSSVSVVKVKHITQIIINLVQSCFFVDSFYYFIFVNTKLSNKTKKRKQDQQQHTHYNTNTNSNTASNNTSSHNSSEPRSKKLGIVHRNWFTILWAVWKLVCYLIGCSRIM